MLFLYLVVLSYVMFLTAQFTWSTNPFWLHFQQEVSAHNQMQEHPPHTHPPRIQSMHKLASNNSGRLGQGHEHSITISGMNKTGATEEYNTNELRQRLPRVIIIGAKKCGTSK